MPGRHSIEIKTLLEQSKGQMKRECHDSDSSLTADSHNHSHTLKSSDSVSTLAQTSSDISLIQDRYLTLEQDYHALLAQTQQKSQLFNRQREELDKYRTLHQKSQKEIERLRSLISIAKKTQQPHSSLSKSTLGESRVGKRDKNGASLPKERMTPITHCKPPLMNKQAVGGKEASGLRKMGGRQREKGQLSRYKFVPTLVQ